MSGNDGGQDEERSKISRRSVVKNAAVLGALSATAHRVGASPTEKNVELDAVLSHPRVEELINGIPGLELHRENTTAYGTDGSVVVVPSNYGKLLATTPDSDAEVGASFYFDEWVQGVDDAWVQGTDAQLTATDDGPLLQRSVTDTERSRFLDAVDRSDFREENTNITVIPERGRVSFRRVDRDEREIGTVTAVSRDGFAGLTQQQSATGTEHAGVELQVVDETTYTASDLVPDSEFSTAAECDDSIIMDIFLCASDYADCGICLGASFAPPVSIACWVILCLDGGLSLAVDYLTDWGCFEAGEGIYECLKDVVDEYGDDIPIPF